MKKIIYALLVLFCSAAGAEDNFIDLTKEIAPAFATGLGQGTNVNPAGDIITADSRSFYFNNEPWLPVTGEFHFSRYPQERWRDELLKIKAGGIDIVATYVFWIHHQEQSGAFDWSGRRDLRKFIQLCDELGLLAIVRLGPWCHGEVRNGGIPDWVQNSGVKLRTNAPAFLEMVRPLYKEIAAQIDGLLWKDGGPVVAVQLDNERNDVPYLLELKNIAQSYGIDVPLYTMTGWNRVAIPDNGLLPLFGAYSVAFWYPQSDTNYRKSFFFTDIRDDGDMGAQFVNQRPYRVENINKYPYVCCEIGGGMPSSYAKRVYVDPDEIAAMSLVRLGCGSNMQGYYMYHGGYNPQGHSWLNEDKPNAMPLIDYDFQAPLGAFGQVREHYFLLRMQHMFIDTFQKILARMPLFLPEKMPSGLSDDYSLRWSVRSDGNSGFVFFNNYQPETDMPVLRNVRFELKTQNGTVKFPSMSTDICPGTYGVFPFNIDFDGVMIKSASVQPVCRVENGDDITWFFTDIIGVSPTISMPNDKQFCEVNNGIVMYAGNDKNILSIEPGTEVLWRTMNEAGKKVCFVVLPFELAKYMSKVSMGGTEYACISDSVIAADGNSMKLYSSENDKSGIYLYPVPVGLNVDGKELTSIRDGVFAHYALKDMLRGDEQNCSAEMVKSAGSGNYLPATDENAWQNAGEWKLNIPETADDNTLLQVSYIGDAARLYCGDELMLDNYYNGKPMEFGLSLVQGDKRKDLVLKVLPYFEEILDYLPEKVRKNSELDSKNLNIKVKAVKSYDFSLIIH